jgi:RimJ/RimL family protein N-acetyltransferase
MIDTATQARPWKPGDPVDIAGLGLRLRSLSPADVDEAFVSELRNPEVLAQLAVGRNPGALTRESLRKSLADFDNRRRFFLGIQPAGEAARLGFCWAIRDRGGAAVLTLVITRRDQWSRGAGSAAIRVFKDFLFDTAGVHKLVARAYDTNVAVIRRLEQYGWVREGVLRQAEPDGKGGWRNVVLFGLLRGENAATPPPPPYSPPPRQRRAD